MRDQQVILESGETFSVLGLVDRLRERLPGEKGGSKWGMRRQVEQLPPSLIVTDMGVELIGYLDAHPELTDHPLWQWQLGLRSHSAWRPEAKSDTRFEFIVPRPVRFGFASQRGGRRRAKGRARWYQVIDVAMFCELPDGWGEPDATELLRFGLELKAWANDNQLPILPSVSAYGSRLLRDARFGGGWRRKVPGATNARIRRLLPGNHYQLLTDRRVYNSAHKFDQKSAHHYAALKTRFPHPDRLEAEGFWRQPAPPDGARMGSRGAIHAGTDRHAELLARPGVFHLAVKVPERVAIDNLAIPALRKPGHRWQTVTSAEVEHLQRTPGVKLLDIWCCWTSPDEDDRLREYAFWSGRQLDHADPSMKRWLKPLLLAAYGMLAVKPHRFRNAWRWCKSTDGAIGWQTSYGTLVGIEKSGKRERESATANVLWRALIESAVRLESLTFAQELRAARFRPISVYADAVFTDCTDSRDPPTPPPWRWEGLVHRLEFETAQRYRCDEETRLPGVPRRRGNTDHNKPVFANDAT